MVVIGEIYKIRVYFLTISHSQITESQIITLGQIMIGVQTGLTDRMLYQRHVVGFLVFPAGGTSICFSLQDLPFFPTYFVAFFVRMLG
jgi:hypothetical protein